jgi:two-component system chemotaxis response regulator CheB
VPIQVLIVDDSAVVRGLLVRALSGAPDVDVIGTAMHGESALRMLRKQPADVVILDVDMPVMDGLTALPQILAEFPRTRVVMASALTSEGAEISVKALALGAAGCIAKPTASSVSQSIEQLVRDLVPLVKALGESCDEPDPPLRSLNRLPRLSISARPDIVVIGSSTGGPNALAKVIAGLGPDFPCPVLIVQHMPPTFTPMLARHLQHDGGRPCGEARHGELIDPGRTYVAPGDFHLSINRDGRQMITVLDQSPPEHFCRPSVNPLFRSAATWFGPRVLAVMLTGMGDDGIEGTQQIVTRGGTVIAQDEASSVVWGMPGAVVREGLAHHVLPLKSIAHTIRSLCLPEVVLR